MKRRSLAGLMASALLLAACHDASVPVGPRDDAQLSRSTAPGQQVRQWFQTASPAVMALPRTVFASYDETGNRIVFGVEAMDVAPRVEAAMSNMRIPGWAYDVQLSEPIHFMNATLRTQHRPTVGGIQIHFSQWVCTLGFNVDHGGGRSFITNSHCTDNQGSTTGTAYFQPASGVDSNPIAVEVDDPAYGNFRAVPGCPRGRQCRYSDAARALYVEGIESLGRIAKTTGANTGSLDVDGSFNITAQDNTSTTFSGTVQKVGRTTGWTSGSVSNTCATVNVSGSNITLLCQTMVSSNQQIVAGGDSGSPVFTGTSNVTLRGILWGGNSSGTMFVFSPFKNIQDELGAMDATTDGVGGGDGGGGGGGDDGGGGGGDDGGGGGGNCPPGNPNHPRCQR